MPCKVRVFVRVRRETKAKRLRVVTMPLLGNTGVISLILELRRVTETYLFYSSLEHHRSESVSLLTSP